MLVLAAVVVFFLRHTKASECSTENYSGNVSITDGGYTCQRWAENFPHVHGYDDDTEFPLDESAVAAENFCRPTYTGVAWCITTNVYKVFDRCNERICGGLDVCGGALENTEGTFGTPDRARNGKYDPDKDCLWTITAPEGKVIELVFQSFRLQLEELCSNDFVQIYDDTMPHGIYCGETIPPTIRSSGQVLYVRFVSDSVEEWAGFNATYSQVLPDLCRKDFWNATVMPNNVVGNLSCPPDVDIMLYSGRLSITVNGENCFSWSHAYYESTSIDRPYRVPEKYCRKVARFSVYWCLATKRWGMECINQLCRGSTTSTTMDVTTEDWSTTTEEMTTSTESGCQGTHGSFTTTAFIPLAFRGIFLLSLLSL